MIKSIKYLLAAVVFHASANCPAQQPKPLDDLPRAVITETKVIEGGGLLFCLRLTAPQGKPLNLSRPHPPVHRPAGTPSEPGDDDPLAFSLAGSILRDLVSQQTIHCLPTVPRIPFFGPMEITTVLPATGWLQMGVAFPPLPPPQEKDGKKQPYQLIFEIPELKIKTPLKLDPDTLKPI